MRDEVMKCPSCSLTLKEPYICCVDCQPTINLCLQCFAKGREFSNHCSFHKYEIKSVSFTLFESKWTAGEEILLLDATEEQGFGNWSEISKKVKTKSREECKDHYLKYYVDHPVPALPKFTVNKEICSRRPNTFKASDNPPRPTEDKPDDLLYIAGYMAPRGDFLVEHDNFAECDLKDVEFDENEEDNLITELNSSIVDIYFSRLREREERKRILGDYGLLDLPSNNALVCKFGREEKAVRDSFRKFARFTTSEEHEKLIQSLLYESYLERKTRKLQEFRIAGLKYFRDTFFYEKLKRRRTLSKRKVWKLDEVLLHTENPLACRVWLQRQMNGKKANTPMPTLPLLQRKPYAPLNLTGVPGLELLTTAEKELCSNLRLLPESYLNHRNVLQKESFQSNGVKLQTARNILKIDVNKTKRLYEFCLNQGYIKMVDS